MPIDVAVIPCAGAGTRLLPATRVIPKPMIPVVDRPVVQYVVEEAVACGITEVVLVVDERPGDPVLSHFTQGDPIAGLEGVSFTTAVQREARGLGDAVLQAAPAVGDRPFLCLVSDSMFPVADRAFTPALVATFEGQTVLAVRQIADELFERYGVVATTGEEVAESLIKVSGAVEKPGRRDAPSALGLVGRYVFPPSIFDALRHLPRGYGGEIQLTDAIDRLARREGAVAKIVEDTLIDVGVPSGLAAATAAVALSRPSLAGPHREFLQQLLDTEG